MLKILPWLMFTFTHIPSSTNPKKTLTVENHFPIPCGFFIYWFRGRYKVEDKCRAVRASGTCRSCRSCRASSAASGRRFDWIEAWAGRRFRRKEGRRDTTCERKGRTRTAIASFDIRKSPLASSSWVSSPASSTDRTWRRLVHTLFPTPGLRVDKSSLGSSCRKFGRTQHRTGRNSVDEDKGRHTSLGQPDTSLRGATWCLQWAYLCTHEPRDRFCVNLTRNLDFDFSRTAAKCQERKIFFLRQSELWSHFGLLENGKIKVRSRNVYDFFLLSCRLVECRLAIWFRRILKINFNNPQGLLI